MTFRISPSVERNRRRGFTLIELILVMTMLVVVAAMLSPRLSEFFKGRTLDSEARRFMTLTRYAQSRAVSEGVPMVLWIDAEQKTYGLEMQPGYANSDEKAVTYQLGRDLTFSVEVPTLQPVGDWELSKRDSVARSYGSIPALLFTPEGFVSQSSPEAVIISQTQEGAVGAGIRVGLSQNRLNYEIQPVNNATGR